MSLRLMVAILAVVSSNALAQNSTVYLQAAQLNDQQAAACANPAGAAYYRKMAAYNRCLASQYGPGGGTCPAPPTGLPSCSSSGGSGTGGSPNVMGTDTGSTGSVKGDLAMAGLKGLLQWKLNHDAKKEAASAGDNGSPGEEDAASQAQDEANEAALAAAQAAARQQQLNNQAAQILTESNSLIASNDVVPSGIPSSSAAINSLLDSGSSTPDSTSAINALLDSPATSGGAGPTTPSAAVNALLAPEDQPASSVATIPNLQELEDVETAEASGVGPDWVSGLANIKDQALQQLQSAADPSSLLPLGEDDLLKKGAETAIQSVVPSPNGEEATLGSVVQDKLVDIASDKVADALTDQKDQLACSGKDSKIEQDVCMVYMAPSNIPRGLYVTGTLLVQRFGTLMTDVNTEISGQKP